MTTIRSSHDAPPRSLDAPLEVDPLEWTHAAVYDLVTSLVVPRPVGWISTVSAAQRPNVAPYSYYNLVADHPPHVAFSSIGIKDTITNVIATGEFVANVAGERLRGALDRTAGLPPDTTDEFEVAGLTPVTGMRVSAPRVAEAPAHLECVLDQIVPVGNGNLVIGRVVHVHVDPSIWRDGRLAVDLLEPVVRLSRRYGLLAPVFTPEEEPSPHVQEPS
jgi:flavin reductase (DIM6/NTAB) family NADH-FMN oxidoreductase RutF